MKIKLFLFLTIGIFAIPFFSQASMFPASTTTRTFNLPTRNTTTTLISAIDASPRIIIYWSRLSTKSSALGTSDLSSMILFCNTPSATNIISQINGAGQTDAVGQSYIHTEDFFSYYVCNTDAQNGLMARVSSTVSGTMGQVTITYRYCDINGALGFGNDPCNEYDIMDSPMPVTSSTQLTSYLEIFFMRWFEIVLIVAIIFVVLWFFKRRR